MLNYPRGEFHSCLEDRGEMRLGANFTSVEHLYRKISFARDRGEINPGVKFTPGETIRVKYP